MRSIRFIKMQGTGNDFVVLDARKDPIPLSAALVSAISSRHFGVGCDLVCRIEPSPDHDARLSFFNADGSEASACGNASRCVAELLWRETGAETSRVETGFGTLTVHRAPDGRYAVNMGRPALDWDRIPLAHAVDIDALPIEGGPGAAGMGNPHMVFLVPDAEACDPARDGPALSRHPLYPEGANVEFCSVSPDGGLRMRVWERGVGVTLACGSGACAAVVVLSRRGVVGRRTRVHLDGGALDIDWREDGVWMTGPAAYVFDGTLPGDWLEAAG